MGRRSLLLLAQERDEPFAARITSRGRDLHRRWVEDVFADALPVGGAGSAEAVDLLVVATDVYTWKLLRLDSGLGRRSAQQRMERLVRAVLALYGDGDAAGGAAGGGGGSTRG